MFSNDVLFGLPSKLSRERKGVADEDSREVRSLTNDSNREIYSSERRSSWIVERLKSADEKKRVIIEADEP